MCNVYKSELKERTNYLKIQYFAKVGPRATVTSRTLPAPTN